MNENTKPSDVREAALALNAMLASLTDEERFEVFDVVLEGYCAACGGSRLPCYCRNDE